MERPKSITVIGIMSVSAGLFTLSAKIYVVTSSERYRNFVALAESMNANEVVRIPTALQMVHGIAGSCIWIFAGICMLKGFNWSRYLALFWGLTVMALTFLSTGISPALYLKAASYCVLLYFLFKPSSKRYFRPMSEA